MSSGDTPEQDVDLGRLFRDGDLEAFDVLYTRYSAVLYDFLARTVRHHAAAEDLTQMTFTRAWERRDQLRDPSRLRSWFFGIAHHLAIDHLRRTRPEDSVDTQIDLMAGDPGPEEQTETREAAELVWAAAASLEPRQYAVLDLTVRQGLSTPDVAQALDVSAKHAAVLVHRAREALGNAVRYLLVARRRDRCEQLAALVPVGVQVLTASQRTSVDHHMRRCAACRAVADRMTAPAELLGLLPLIPPPPKLQTEGREKVLAAARLTAPMSGAPRKLGRPPAPGHRLRRPRVIVAAALALLILGGGLGAALVLRDRAQTRPVPSAVAGQPAAASATTVAATPTAIPTVPSTPKPIPTPAGTPIAGLGTVTCVPVGPTGQPGAIALGMAGSVWAAAGPNVYQISPDGQVHQFTLPNHGAGTQYVSAITMSSDGNVWFAQTTFSQGPGQIPPYYVGAVTPAGGVADFILPAGDRIAGLAADSRGIVWASTLDTGEILRLTPTGVAARYRIAPGAQVRGLTVGPGDLIWFTIATNEVGSIDSGGHIRLLPAPGASTYSPGGMTADTSGNLWFADNKAGGGVGGDPGDYWVGRMTATGQSKLFHGSMGASPQGGGVPVSAAPGGAVWFVGFQHTGTAGKSGVGLIGRVATDGTVTTFQLADYDPSGVIATSDSSIWFSDTSRYAVCQVQTLGA